MNVSARSLFTLAIAFAVAALHACGGNENQDATATPAAPAAPAPGGEQNAPPPGTTSADASTSKPATCPILDQDAGLPDIAPACAACVVDKCCAQITACFGAPRDAGLPGTDAGDGMSGCMRFGDCVTTCIGGADAGDVIAACEDACRAKYGDEAANASLAVTGCIYDPAPAGCACP